MRAVLQIYAFGKLQLSYEGNVITSFPTIQVEELLGYLVLNQDTPHLRTKLIHLLWPDLDLDKARGRFNTVIWRLKRVLTQLGIDPDTCLQIKRDTVVFAPLIDAECDVRQFQRCCREAELMCNDIMREEVLITAVGHYRGELLEGVYADWSVSERERYAQAYLHVLNQLMLFYEVQGAYEEVLKFGQMALEEDMLQEEIHRMMMYAHWRLGHVPRALQQYEFCTQILDEQMGLLPMNETIALYTRITQDRLDKALSQQRNVSGNDTLQQAIMKYKRASDELAKLLH